MMAVFLAVGLLALLTLLFPAASILRLWKKKPISKSDWFLTSLAAGSVVVFVYLNGLWAYTGYWLKYVMVLFFIGACARSYHRFKYRNIFAYVERGGRSGYLRAGVIVVFLLLSIISIKGRFYKGTPVELAFPLRDGKYIVLQGGSTLLTNPFHRTNSTQKYAIDIVELNSFGTRAAGILPDRLSGYTIYGDILYSPCDGRVMRSVDGVSDNLPGHMDRERPAGNHLIIECGDVYVMLAHMSNGSVRVKKGEKVREGQVMGTVGNSGNSLEPHLHIQATRDLTGVYADGEAVPITFDARFLFMNTVVKGMKGR